MAEPIRGSCVCGAGALDDDPGVKPKLSIHFDSRAPWYLHGSELEMHGTIPQS